MFNLLWPLQKCRKLMHGVRLPHSQCRRCFPVPHDPALGHLQCCVVCQWNHCGTMAFIQRPGTIDSCKIDRQRTQHVFHCLSITSLIKWGSLRTSTKALCFAGTVGGTVALDSSSICVTPTDSNPIYSGRCSALHEKQTAHYRTIYPTDAHCALPFDADSTMGTQCGLLHPLESHVTRTWRAPARALHLSTSIDPMPQNLPTL